MEVADVVEFKVFNVAVSTEAMCFDIETGLSYGIGSESSTRAVGASIVEGNSEDDIVRFRIRGFYSAEDVGLAGIEFAVCHLWLFPLKCGSSCLGAVNLLTIL